MNDLNLQKLMDRASEMAMKNVWGENAYKINMTILRSDPNNTAACTRLAKYYKLNDNIKEAESLYLKTLEIDPGNRGAINNLNDIERERQENEYVNKIETVGKLFQAGQSSALKGKYKLALKLFSKAYGIEPLLKYAVSLAGVYKKLGKYDSIETLYKQLIETNKHNTDVDAINSEFKLLRLNTSPLVAVE